MIIEKYYKVDGYAPLPENFYKFISNSTALNNTMTTPLNMGTFTLSQTPMNYIMIRAYINDDGNYYPVYTDYEYVQIVNPFAQISVNTINSLAVYPNYTLAGTVNANTSTLHTVSVTVTDDRGNIVASKPVPHASIQIIRLPPAYYSLYTSNQDNIMTINLPGSNTDTSGKATFTFKI